MSGSPPKLNTLSYVILGVLTSKDWSAYELAEQVGRGLDDIWSRADRQRYNAAKHLADLGLVEATVEATGRRTRTIYSITDAGRAALAAWLTERPQPMTMEFEGMVRVLVADDGTIDDLRRTIEDIGEQAATGRDRYAAHAQFMLATGGTFPEREHTFALANRFMIGHFTNIIDWSAWALDEIASWPDTTSPAQTHRDRTRAILELAPLPRTPPGEPA
ncbi:PadR family transcriptional regulator [Aquihabitans sp. McL0605]|uniref:PadR family transcriptional regulator n=1 Tax=Aquihabitans sp. McL0605 TaxID=3415671 RepID=UPI003CED2F56